MGATDPGVPWAECVYCLLDLGSLSGSSLFFRQLHFAILFTGDCWGLAPQLVRAEAELVAGMALILARVVDPVGTGRIQAYLLLL